MSTANRVALLEEFIRAWSAKDVDALMDLMAEDCEFRSSLGAEPGTTFVGRDEVRRGYELFLGPTDEPAPETEISGILVNDDFAVVRWTSLSPDGSSVEVRACDIFEFEGDRIKVKDTYRKVRGELR
ncbi:hypothetical protein TH66_16925 [Carbonactinospora thermoautotrophica]|uniref:SnoaL-like domain-containing protein n=2 Tax=Carbonactinospora thermoautotrophica TaxID=1469144 RepID=A0A132NI34_9ACTN|nr:nuclear transport factor 2 family protein [Carbonactinospora thermoautotrophica]KWX00455.1 hypothetical protein TH66_16925 [Carbonactinospora thermoautotrophica]KWX09749.1 hypothetical protein TR74_07740 [Carbonactinospora thermoautotrophica]